MINYKEKFSLNGKKAVVTGGAGLIGKEVVSALVQAGAHVVVADINEKTSRELVDSLKTHAFNAEYCFFDVTELDLLETRIEKLVELLGGIDIWVNSAYPRTKDFICLIENVSVESWRKNVDMHLNSYGLSSRYVAEHMKKRGGNIINFSSIYGVGGPDFTVYENTEMTNSIIGAAIKGGINNLDRYLASYYGKYNVRINTICPGGVFDSQNPVFVKNYSKRTPLSRMAKAEEAASVVLFLASDAASYITGATIMVDGGWTAV